MITNFANTHRLPWCCGIIEAGYFKNFDRATSHVNDISAKTTEELLTKILERWEGYPILFNFYREIDYEDRDRSYESDDYEASDLRELVMKHPNAKHLANFINPNSGNRVDSWMIFTGEIPYECD